MDPVEAFAEKVAKGIMARWKADGTLDRLRETLIDTASIELQLKQILNDPKPDRPSEGG